MSFPDVGNPDPASQVGAIAQLGERLDGIQEVVGSIPTGSTNTPASRRTNRGRFFAATGRRRLIEAANPGDW